MKDAVPDHYLASAFRRQKDKALQFIEAFNDKLPAQHCPNCHAEGHVPGLPCHNPECGYKHDVSWAILLDTEFGYEVVALNNRKLVFACFNVTD